MENRSVSRMEEIIIQYRHSNIKCLVLVDLFFTVPVVRKAAEDVTCILVGAPSQKD